MGSDAFIVSPKSSGQIITWLPWKAPQTYIRLSYLSTWSSFCCSSLRWLTKKKHLKMPLKTFYKTGLTIYVFSPKLGRVHWIVPVPRNSGPQDEPFFSAKLLWMVFRPSQIRSNSLRENDQRHQRRRRALPGLWVWPLQLSGLVQGGNDRGNISIK